MQNAESAQTLQKTEFIWDFLASKRVNKYSFFPFFQAGEGNLVQGFPVKRTGRGTGLPAAGGNVKILSDSRVDRESLRVL